MISLVLAAGESKRFKDAGYKKPKQFLEMPDGNFMIDYVLFGLPSNTILVTKEEDCIGIDYENVTFSTENTGPLSTAIDALNQLSSYPDQELLVVYSDVLFGDYDRFVLKCRTNNCDSGVVLFPVEGSRFDYHSENWSYGAVYYFESVYRFLVEAKNKLVDADIKDNLYGKITTYKVRKNQHIDLGMPEDYESYMDLYKGDI